MNIIDKFLNSFTMYRVVMYGLLIMVAWAFGASFLGLLAFKPFELLALLATLIFTCYFVNILLSKVFKAIINAESSLVTALILFFLLWPSVETQNILVFIVAGVVAMLSKYVLAYKKKHIFNPAAFAAVFLIVFNTGALWWIATPTMLPITLLVGLLIVRKIRKFTLFFTFLFVTLTSFLFQAITQGLNPIDQTSQFFLSFPVIFFGTVMLTEPLTLPPTKKLQILYAILMGILFSWQGPFPVILTTELVLVIGNIFSFIVSPKYRLYLALQEKAEIAHDTLELVFKKPTSFTFKPGQYLEWTIPLAKADGRGNRRYFTIASSPTEDTLRLGIKLNNPSSTFKKILQNLKPQSVITAGQLIGDFTLPNDASKKLVFIAGGIGVTPFRSMIKYLIDKNEKRDIVFFYANKNENEIAYGDLFDEATIKLGLKVIYILSDEKNAPPKWNGEVGRIDEKMFTKYVKNPSECLYYLSGPNAMVENYKKLLRQNRVKPTSIVTDYFPGF